MKKINPVYSVRNRSGVLQTLGGAPLPYTPPTHRSSAVAARRPFTAPRGRHRRGRQPLAIATGSLLPHLPPHLHEYALPHASETPVQPFTPTPLRRAALRISFWAVTHQHCHYARHGRSGTNAYVTLKNAGNVELTN